MNELNLISRKNYLFDQDIDKHKDTLSKHVRNSKFLVIGGAGSIGQAVCKEIFLRQPQLLHVVDISENNLVELVRDLRSSYGYLDGEFRTFALDVTSSEFDFFMRAQENYDFVLNLSALKHVRSEKDPYTLMRMISTNILSVVNILNLCKEKNVKKYFCVSTDKAANPANLMGASKRIMEMFLTYESQNIEISSARFANVAFSDGSLLFGLNQRFKKKQPISAPYDIKRYFITSKEAGELCLMSCLLGKKNQIFFPKESSQLQLTDFKSIIFKFLKYKGFKPYLCKTEEEARNSSNELIMKGLWPCYFFVTDTSGEKLFEEFYTKKEDINLDIFSNIGVIKNSIKLNDEKLNNFIINISKMRDKLEWNKQDIVREIKVLLPDFIHDEISKNLDQRM